MRSIKTLKDPWGVATNTHREMVVSDFLGHTVSLLDRGGKEILTYGSEGDRPDQLRFPTDVAVDSDNNVYVASENFRSSVEMVTSSGVWVSTEVRMRSSGNPEVLDSIMVVYIMCVTVLTIIFRCLTLI